jgi:putative transposase
VSRVYLQGIGDVKVDMHRQVEGVVKTITIKREGNRWFVVLSCDNVPQHLLEPTHEVAGIDVGVASFLTTSDGEHVGNPRFGAGKADSLAHAQRVLAGKKRGSGNRRKAKAVVANRHRKVANCRRDFHHKTALGLVRNYDLLAVEDLSIANMSASASGTVEAPGTNVAQKSGLNRAILDAGWGSFIACLRAKAEDAGRTVVAVNPRHTSQTCPECGHVEAGNRVSQSVFRCLACGFKQHADVVGARNILRAGLARLAAERPVV